MSGGSSPTGLRVVKFHTVGAGGFLVQMGCLWALVHVAGLHYMAASALALEAAILHNFVWHAGWTWADRRAAGPGWPTRLVRFNLLHGLTAACALAIIALLVEVARLPVLAAAAASVAVCAAVNFIASDRAIFAGAVVLLLMAPPAAAAGPDPPATVACDSRLAAPTPRPRRAAPGYRTPPTRPLIRRGTRRVRSPVRSAVPLPPRRCRRRSAAR